MRAVFGLDACPLFLQGVLVVIPLIGGMQMHSPRAHSQEGEDRGWLPVVGPSLVVATAGRVLPGRRTLHPPLELL